jgi:hypothetical protein
MNYPNAWTVAQASAGPYDNSNNPAAAAALAADQARVNAASAPITVLGRTEVPVTPERIQQINDLQTRGRAIGDASSVIANIRSGAGYDANSPWTRGFDVATATCQNTSLPGPGQNAVRYDLGRIAGTRSAPLTQAGFDVGQALQHGMTKTAQSGIVLSTNPGVAAGQLAIHGIAGSTITGDQKANVATTVAGTSPAAKAGVVATLPTVTPGLFRRFLNWIEGK